MGRLPSVASWGEPGAGLAGSRVGSGPHRPSLIWSSKTHAPCRAGPAAGRNFLRFGSRVGRVASIATCGERGAGLAGFLVGLMSHRPWSIWPSKTHAPCRAGPAAQPPARWAA